MGRVKRFSKRKKVRHEIDVRHGLSIAADQSLVNEFLNSEIDIQAIEEIDEMLNIGYGFEFNIEVSDQEVNDLLQTLEKGYNDQVFDEVIRACKNDTLRSIIGPFGLGGLVAKFDKDGGNVDTIYNVRDGVFATEKEKIKYENRTDYNPDEYHKQKDYKSKNKNHSQMQIKGILKDGYTGETFARNDNRELDHIKPAKEIHNDPGRILAEVEGYDLANKGSNLTSTAKHLNKIKSTLKVEELNNKIKNDELDRRKRIEELYQKNNLTPQERVKLEKLELREKYDPKKAKSADKQARKDIDKTLNKAYYTSKKFAKNVAITGVKEGVKMGFQQALGIVLCEFFTAAFEELQEIYRAGFSTGFDDSHFFQVFKKRLSHIAQRTSNRWKDAFKGFGSGFLSGFMSNLVTVIINMFVSTTKRMVRIIREGLFSLLKAIKIVCFPPETMTLAQAAHEASKLIAAGLTISGGIIVEEFIDKLIKATPPLEVFADIITGVVVGSLTGIAATFIVYAIDRVDFFRVKEFEKRAYVISCLETNLELMFSESDEVIEQISFDL